MKQFFKMMFASTLGVMLAMGIILTVLISMTIGYIATVGSTPDYTPKSNTEFWVNKISGNRERDAVVKRELEESGWKVIVVWECSIRHSKNFVNLVNGLCNKILNNS